MKILASQNDISWQHCQIAGIPLKLLLPNKYSNPVFAGEVIPLRMVKSARESLARSSVLNAKGIHGQSAAKLLL